jgi:hypothetical protein
MVGVSIMIHSIQLVIIVGEMAKLSVFSVMVRGIEAIVIVVDEGVRYKNNLK